MSQNQMPRVALLNDTSLFSSHFGCQLVGQVFREQFKRVGLNLVYSLPKRFSLDEHTKELSNVDLVIVNGEGSIHHGRNLHLLDVALKYPSVLLNTTYQQNPANTALGEFLYIAVRESYSASEIRGQGIDCHIVPDVIFNSSFIKSFPAEKPTRDLGVTDNAVKEYIGKWPFRRKYEGDFNAHGLTPAEYLKEVCSYRRMCIGRFHAAVVCCVLGIPFSTWDSNTWKLKAMMEDMGLGHLHFSSRQEAMEHIPDVLPSTVRDFVEQARVRIEKMFDDISLLAHDKMER